MNKTRTSGLIAIIIFALILARTVFFSQKPQIDLEKLPHVQLRSAPAPVAQAKPDTVNFREIAHADSLFITVDSVDRWRDKKGALFQLDPKHEYFATYVTLENRGSTVRKPIMMECSLIDNEDSAWVPNYSVHEPNLALPDSMPPYSLAAGWITYTIKKSTTPVMFRYHELLTASEANILLPKARSKP